MPGPPNFRRFGWIDFDSLGPAVIAPLGVNDQVAMRRAAGGPNVVTTVGAIQAHGGAVNIADLLGGTDDQLLVRIGGIWTSSPDVIFDGSKFRITGTDFDLDNSAAASAVDLRARNSAGGIAVQIAAGGAVELRQLSGGGANEDFWINMARDGGVTIAHNNSSMFRTVVAASGGAEVNNTVTGGGFERALTTSDLGGGSITNDVVQARRTTILNLTTAFVDVTLDATDVETDSAVIEHDVITDRIVAKVAGTYEIDYQFNIDSATAVSSTVEVDGRVRLNDGGTGINGSLATESSDRDGGGAAAVHPSHMSCKFIVTLAANDFVTLQVQKVDIVGTETYFIDETSLQVTRLI